ncbi:uncharacterized protein F5Z01DRAFT_685937 [Emericellopsis atlantica]|uniref:NB-ARC domain-containing protein n=1 Tax=Emericellopsis atlantica TaxID=2614577 RepID=A0A9P7ZNN9_9HYPO|nr:uncharacterized protein F5Z01DRAFT_685937 [Emericellopsis atlantica]KAG9255474.1 hypothetical protein F5Z01DRAFT_685937 [Emericellopsis atlantica]
MSNAPDAESAADWPEGCLELLLQLHVLSGFPFCQSHSERFSRHRFCITARSNFDIPVVCPPPEHHSLVYNAGFDSIHAVRPSVDMATPGNVEDVTIHEIWADAAAGAVEAMARVNSKGSRLQSMSYEAMQQSMDDLRQRHASSRSSRCFRKLEPVMSHLRTFSNAIGVFTQSNPEIACLVSITPKKHAEDDNGASAILITVYQGLGHPQDRSRSTLERIVILYGEICRAMPRFEQYMQLFPRRQPLRSALHSIYAAYLDFSVQAAYFFRRPILVHLTMSFFKIGALTETFNRATNRINVAAAHFEAEAGLALAITTSSELSNISNTLPHLHLLPKAPTRLFSVPWPRKASFFERQHELELMQQLLAPNASEQMSCVLHGMPGVGKTQCALEFSFRRKEVCPFVFWIPAEDETVLAQAFGKISVLLGLHSKNESVDLALQVEKTCLWLCQKASSLLNRYWPACGHGSILVTSQDRKIGHRSRSKLHLSPLTEEQGSRLLLHLQNISKPSALTRDLVRELSSEVGGLPLLLAGLAGYMADSHMSIATTLQAMQRSWNKNDSIIHSIDPHSVTFQYQVPIHKAYDMSLSKLGDFPISVLRVMSILSPDRVSEEPLIVDTDSCLEFPEQPDKLRHEPHTMLRSSKLTSQESGPPFYSMHRQLQWKVLTDLKCDPQTRQYTFDLAVALVQQEFPPLSEYMVPMFGQWDFYKKSIAHITSLREVFISCSQDETPIQGRLDFAKLLTSAGNYLYETGIAETGLEVSSTSVDICEKYRLAVAQAERAACTLSSLSKESYAGMSELNKLEATALTISWGIISQNHGASGGKDATTRIEKVLELREKHAQMDLPQDERFWSRVLLSNAYNDVGCQYIHMHQYEKAEFFLPKSLSLKNVLSSQQEIPAFEYAESKNNLAFVRIGQGRFQEALEFSQEATEIIDKADGPANDHTRFNFCHGLCLFRTERTEEALERLRSVYRVRVATFGVSSRNARDTAFAIAYILHRLGRMTEARQAILTCFDPHGNATWSRECLFRAQYLYSMILESLIQPKQAKELASEALVGLEQLWSALPLEIQEGLTRGDSREKDPLISFDLIVPYTAGRFVDY